MKIYCAPLQGFTDAPYRHFHAQVFGGVDSYCAPFMRLERGAPMPRDIRDITSPLNAGLHVIPQVIASGPEEFSRLADTVAASGHTEVDLNMGCPFPPQVKRGRGAGLITAPDRLALIAREMESRPDMKFSVKMRLGATESGQWRDVIDIVNAMPLQRVTVHPRTARQLYGGELYLDEADALIAALRHPVVFNGDILSPADIDRIAARYPGLEGVMNGRGLLARPSIAAEWREGREWTRAERMDAIMRLHEGVSHYYIENLCGDTQILSKLRPFWEYLEPEIGHRPAKAIRKATSLSKYNAALATII